MTDKCPFCGHAKATEGSEVYQCGTRWNEPEKLVRTHNCYNREIANLRAVADAAVEIISDTMNGPYILSGIQIGRLFGTLVRAGYLLTPPSGEEN